MDVKGLDHIEKIKRKLAATFKMVDMGPISFYLGLKVEKNYQKKTLKLSQPVYINKILVKYYLNLAKSCNTLMKEAIFFPSKRQKAT